MTKMALLNKDRYRHCERLKGAWQSRKIIKKCYKLAFLTGLLRQLLHNFPRNDEVFSSYQSLFCNAIKINKVLVILLFALVIPITSYGKIIPNYYGNIVPTYSVDSVTIKNLLPQIDADTLVLVNIDNTIITPKSKLFRYQDNSYINFTKYLYSLAVANSSVNKTIAQLIEQRQMMLVESKWVDLINKMKQQGAMVLGLQEITTPCNLIENYEGWLYTLLYGLNINFTNKFNDKDVFRFNPSDANAPIFYLGIIFTGSINKVRTLIEFLKIMPKQPRKIVIFANNKKDLENMDSYLRMVDIEYYGIEYLGWTQLPGSPDHQIAELQQSTLLNTGQWLEDDTAAKMLNIPNSKLQK